MKILIADDTRVVQIIIKKSLEKSDIANLDIKTASNGLEAFEIVKSWQPNIVITDWHMPHMTGLEMMKKMYANGMNHIKVGFITAEPTKENLESAKRFGAEFVLSKPCTEDDIIAEVKKLVAKFSTGDKSSTATKKTSITDHSLNAVLSKRFGDAIAIEEIDGKPSDELNGTYLIALFGTPISKTIRAISIIDKRCIYLLGTLLNNTPFAEVIELSEKEGVDSDIAKLATDFLAESGSDIFASLISGKKPEILEIKSKGVVNQLPEKVCATIDSGENRQDFKLSHPEFGDCFMTIVTL